MRDLKLQLIFCMEAYPILIGITAGILCSFFAYFYQSALTGIAQYEIKNQDSIPQGHKWYQAMSKFKFRMVASALASVVFFAIGIITTSIVFINFRM